MADTLTQEALQRFLSEQRQMLEQNIRAFLGNHDGQVTVRTCAIHLNVDVEITTRTQLSLEEAVKPDGLWRLQPTPRDLRRRRAGFRPVPIEAIAELIERYKKYRPSVVTNRLIAVLEYFAQDPSRELPMSWAQARDFPPTWKVTLEHMIRHTDTPMRFINQDGFGSQHKNTQTLRLSLV